MNLNVGGGSHISYPSSFSSSSSSMSDSDDELESELRNIDDKIEEALILRMISNNLLLLAYLNQREDVIARKRKMRKKRNLLKGQQRKKSIPPSRHGETSRTRKGKRVVEPSKETKEMGADAESSKFITNSNEEKAATVADKDGGESSIIKSQPDSTSGAK